MADDSSEQVAGQQTNESSRAEVNSDNDEASKPKGLGHGPHAGEGTPAG